MMVEFQASLLHKVVSGDITVIDAWIQKQKIEYTKQQAKIQMMIVSSLSTRLTQQLMDKDTGTEMWS